MRILILTQWCTPEKAFKSVPFARELVKLGHKVYVLTGFPNYPVGRLYPGYKIRPWAYEEIDSIPVHRVALYPSHDRSPIKRILNYTSFAFSASTFGPFLIPKVDVAYVFHPPATIGLPATIFKLLRGIPFVIDIQDLWPDTLTVTGMFNNKVGLAMVGRFCRFVYSQAARIVVLSPGFKERLSARGVPPDKIEVIYNWCDESSLSEADYDKKLARELGLTDRFNVLFAGNMGLGQALDAVLDSAKILQDSVPKIQFVFIGSGLCEPFLKERAQKMNLRNVRFLPRRQISEIPPVFALADVLLVHLKDDPLFRITIPGKTQVHLHVGKPILIGVRGDATDLVLRAGAGISCTPEDSDSIANAVVKMYKMPREKLDEMGRNGRRFYDRELAREIGVKKFVAIFSDVVKKSF